MSAPGHRFKIDVLIFGAGIAGCWLAHRLHREGRRVALLEAGAVGGVQSLASQGVIHGGLKYALNGMLTDSSENIRDMPERWRICLDGQGEVDLAETRILSPSQVLWSESGLASRITTFFASKTLASRLEKLSPDEYPEALQNPGFRGTVYRLDELALDVPSVIRCLCAPLEGRVFHLRNPEDMTFHLEDGRIHSIDVPRENGPVSLVPETVIFAAGSGNEFLMKKAGISGLPAMQRRPLHQLMIRGTKLPPLYSVCMGAGSKPRLVSTTHPMEDGSRVWYLGGELAETGVNLDADALIEAGKSLLHRLLPWMDFSACQWGTLKVDRAECRAVDGERPSGVHASTHGNLMVVWPTKLAMAPVLGDVISDALQGRSGPHPDPALPDLPDGLWPAPPMGRTPWEATFS